MHAPPAPTLARRPLPIGIQNLREIREGGHYYVDKSGLAIDLIESGKLFFLSRPRRFGKSLLVDTLKELFEGNRALFTGLAAETRWDWTRRHPVIRLDFAGGVLGDRAGLDERLHELLDDHEALLGVSSQRRSTNGRLAELIQRAHERHGAPVVVLIDEYDKPILDNLDRPAIAREMRDGLRNVYSVLKASDAHLKFVFLTGVSKFSKVSIFSGLNNLRDITLDARWSALCGYTDTDLDSVFAPELPGLDRDEIRRWYNGYNWTGEPVYNPFDMLLLFDSRQFRPYWFETGTPTFLIKLLSEQQFFTPRLQRLQSSLSLLSSFDVEQIAPEALLFQTGYLTVHEVRQPVPGRWVYTLGYPNREVESSLNEALLLAHGVPGERSIETQDRVIDSLRRADLPALAAVFRTLFASIPHDWYRRNALAQAEGYYASVFYSHLAALGLDIRVEDTTNHGRIDLTVRFEGQVFLFEFKVVDSQDAATDAALQQIRARGYADKYLGRGEPVHRVGVTFGRRERNLVGFESETVG
ncbi:ATP-binding protein [Sphaerotilus sp.]|uniref:ATP-binding protein n=1 Tax=Sphaerotilus sp. TaxID=2093942 RepID=UPI002ACD75EB|nr:ATP-binding protein [Sphaerotilus sp.]MDZ7856311.1 ATP-binding protein [Sphaerotilus sp.]